MTTVTLVTCALLGLVTQSSLTLSDPMDCSPPGSSAHGILQTRILEWVSMPSSRGSPQPRDKTQVSCFVRGFFTISATREAMNTGLGSLSRLQGIFLDQESNQSLLHCRWVLYQGFPGGSDSKASACNAGNPGSIPGLGRSPGEGNSNPLLPRKFHGWRRLVGYSPWGHKQSDTTERLHFHFSFFFVYFGKFPLL